MSINKVILVGNVGKDPEVRHLESNVAVANFTLATSENYTNKSGEKVVSTEWHNVVCWRGLATLAENFIRKGSQIYVEGRIKTRTYDAPDGSKRYATEIYADTIQLLGKKEVAPTLGQNVATGTPGTVVNEPNDNVPFTNDEKEADDLPF